MNDPIPIPKRWRGRRWSALATSVRARNPICERCKERFSEEVHHTMPLHKGGSLYDPRNLVALCKECHQGPVMGWHGQRRAWAIRKLDELDALNVTLERLAA